MSLRLSRSKATASATDSMEVEIEMEVDESQPHDSLQSAQQADKELPSRPRQRKTSRIIFEANKVMRAYDQSVDGTDAQDRMHAMALDYVKEKKTRRLATKAAIAMGVIILLVVGLNAGLTAAIVFLSKDVKDVKVINGMLTDPVTNKPVKVSSADTLVVDGALRDQASNKVIATASALQSLEVDSRLPDSAWDELKYIDVRNDKGGSVHLFVQAFTRVPNPHALHGSFVMIHSTIGTITLDGDLMTFSDSIRTGVFTAARFAVTSSGRRLAGIVHLIGFFNRIPSFDAWNTTYDVPPLIPPAFYANASLLYACTYKTSNLCDHAHVPAGSLTVFADKLWAVSGVDVWADLNAGIGKEVYWSLANNPGWTLEKHLDLKIKTEHVMQTWQKSNESYFCRTTPQPQYMSSWLSPLSATNSRASYKGGVDGERYGARAGEVLHHFQIKPLEAEHISLDFYSHLLAEAVIPSFVQLRIGSDTDDTDARFVAYKFHSFNPLQSLPAAGAIFNQTISYDHFNETHCADTLAYTDQDREGTKIHRDNMIHGTDPFVGPPSRTALTYILADHPTWKASEIVAWEDQLSNDLPAYMKYRQYLDYTDDEDGSEPADEEYSEPADEESSGPADEETLTYEQDDAAEPEVESDGLSGRRLSHRWSGYKRPPPPSPSPPPPSPRPPFPPNRNTCDAEESDVFCENYQWANGYRHLQSVAQCKEFCRTMRWWDCTGGHFDASKPMCYLFGSHTRDCIPKKARPGSGLTGFKCISLIPPPPSPSPPPPFPPPFLRTCTEEPDMFCKNWVYAKDHWPIHSADQCRRKCDSKETCSGGYYDIEKRICYLFGKPDAVDQDCTPTRYTRPYRDRWGRLVTRVTRYDCPLPPSPPPPHIPRQTCTACSDRRDYPLKMEDFGPREGWWQDMWTWPRVWTLGSCLDKCRANPECMGVRWYDKGYHEKASGKYRCVYSKASCVFSQTCNVQTDSIATNTKYGRDPANRISLVHFRRATNCNEDSTEYCNPDTTITTSGFPFNVAKAKSETVKAMFPCDIKLGLNGDVACQGEVTCSSPDVPLCCNGLVTGSVSGTGKWDCARDYSICSGGLAITGAIGVGIPKCDWCPKVLSISVSYERIWGEQKCCSGRFAYSMDKVILAGEFLSVIKVELAGSFWQMITDNDEACKTARPNYIDGQLRKLVIEGKIEICVFFCFTVASGRIFMDPGGPQGF